MDDVCDHVIPLPLDLLLAGMVEVKLDDLIFLPCYRNLASRRVVDLNGVAVVDDLQGRCLVVEFDRRQLSFFSAPDVDRRLFVSQLADSVFWTEIAPVFRTFRAGVGPLVALGGVMLLYPRTIQQKQ